MHVTVNGSDREVAAGATVAELADELSAARPGTAIAVDGNVVPRGRWPEQALREGAVVEVVNAVQGG